MMVYYLGAGLVIIPDFTATSQQTRANVVPKGNTPTVVDSIVVHVQLASMPLLLVWKNAIIVAYNLFLITKVFLVTLHYKKALLRLVIVTVTVQLANTDL